jgi:hypothetical protein
MKYFIFLCSLLLHFSLWAQHSLQKLWVTDTILPLPESVLYDAENKLLYVSCMDGSSTERDGKGGIARVGTNGKIIDLNWITGLNAPKGMARYKTRLYVADLTEIVIIDILHGKVLTKITVDSAKVLNDVTVDIKGIVYVSDPGAGKVFKLENDNYATIYLDNLVKPNGLKAIGNYLFMLANGSLYKINKQKTRRLIAEGMDENTDGIEQVKRKEFIVSCWTGVIYYVDGSGNKQVLSDTRKQAYYTADIGYNAKAKTIFVPALFKKTVSAYKVRRVR